MNNQLKLPEEEVDAKLISNLRRARLDFEEVGLQLEEVIAKFEAAERKQRLKKIKQKHQL